MPDYEPINLSSLCNAEPELLGSEARPLVGGQTFHGLPFQIGRRRATGATGDKGVLPYLFLGFGPGVRTDSCPRPKSPW